MCADERAAAEVRRRTKLGQHIEDGENPVPRVGVLGKFFAQPLLARLMPCKEIGADQTILAAEGVVQRRLRYARMLDDAIDADRVDASPIEEIFCGGEEALAGGAAGGGLLGHR